MKAEKWGNALLFINIKRTIKSMSEIGDACSTYGEVQRCIYDFYGYI